MKTYSRYTANTSSQDSIEYSYIVFLNVNTGYAITLAKSDEMNILALKADGDVIPYAYGNEIECSKLVSEINTVQGMEYSSEPLSFPFSDVIE